MKTKLFFGHVLKYTTYVFVFMWTLISANAQCPTITDPAPPAICDAAGYTFADLSGAYATDNGGGIVWYSAPTGGTIFYPDQLVSEGTYYADDSSGTCGSRSQIDITFTVGDSGIINRDHFYCSNENVIFQDYIDLILQPGIPSGGNVKIYYDSGLTNQANAADLIPLGVADYYIVFDDGGVCRSQIEKGRIGVFLSPADPTPADPQEFCINDNPTIADLDPGTVSSVNWYQGVDVNGNPIPPALSTSTSLTNGKTYYVQIDEVLCDSNAVPVTVTINTPNNPGTSGRLDYCQNNVPTSDFDLFDSLGVPKDNNGVWSGPITTSNGYRGTVNISRLTTLGIYTFTYTVPATGACPASSSTVTITIYETFSSGTALSPAIFCESGLPSSFDLFSLLDGTQDPNGQWTEGTLSTDPVVTSPINLSGLIQGDYFYTYTQNLSPNPCAEESTTVQVRVLKDPNAGTAINQTFCENDLATNSPFNLFDALTAPYDSGGSWTDSSNTAVPDPLNLDITSYTVVGSPYTFNYTVDNGTCIDTETVSITIAPAPESGTPIATFPEFCISEITTGQTVDLFGLLDGEDQTGIWADDDGSGALSGNSVTIDGLSIGTYNFTYDVAAIGSCDDVNVTVSITINDTPAPTASPTQEFCDSAMVSNLTATGTTIQWYDVPSGGTALPGTTALVNGQMYYATQTTGCESSTRTAVTATIYQSPNAGNANTTPIVACSGNNSIDLNTGLDGTQGIGGIWQDTDGTGALAGNIFDATVNGAGTYQFTYYVPASSPCVDDSTLITVTIEDPLSAGTDNTLDVCSNNGTTDLFTLLGSADTGGTWSPAMASGTGVFDPLVDAQGSYTYSLTNACGTFSSKVDVTVTQAPNAGSDNAVLICVIDGPTDLFTFLGTDVQTGGTWSPALPSGTGVFDPSTDANGTYTYTVSAISPCATDSSAQITVTVDDSSAPTVVTANSEFCLEDNPTVADLDASLSATGTINWYTDATLVTALAPTDTLTDGEDYFATQTNSSGCESSQNVQVNVTVNDAPTPTLINPNLELCINDNPTIMELTLNISEYNSNTDNVIWYDAPTGGSSLSSSLLLSYGVTYHAALYDASTGCESSVRLAVTPDVTSCGKIRLPDGFSPNGDGVNDTYDYNNMDILYPNFEIEIFNRYGNIVYKGSASNPRFDGTSNQARTLVKGDLPVGVYFYIFKFNDGENKPEQGRLYLSR